MVIGKTDFKRNLGPVNSKILEPNMATYLTVVMNLGQRHSQKLHVPRHDELLGHRQPDQEQLDAFLHGATGFKHSNQNNGEDIKLIYTRYGDILYLGRAEVWRHVWKWDGLKFGSPPHSNAFPNLVSNKREKG